MSVRAKFKCTEKDAPEDDGACNITLEPVVGGNEENKSFYKYTPWGKLEMGVVSPTASMQFSVGKEYYVDFSEAPDSGG